MSPALTRRFGVAALAAALAACAPSDRREAGAPMGAAGLSVESVARQAVDRPPLLVLALDGAAV